MEIGELIKNTRVRKGMTQAELAERLGVTPQAISQYERGVKKPKYETIKKIAMALDASLSDFLMDDACPSDERIFAALEEIMERVLRAIENERATKGNPYKYFDSETRKTWILQLIPEISEKYAIPEGLLEDNAPRIIENALFSKENIPLYNGEPVEKLIEMRPKHYRLMIDYLDMLNETGQKVALERVSELVLIPKYQKTPINPAGDSTQSADAGDKEDPE